MDVKFAESETSTNDFINFESLSTRVLSEEKNENTVDGAPSFSITAKVDVADANTYRVYYFRNPNVPIDFPSVSEAVKHCPRTSNQLALTDDSAFYSGTGTVVLMPGVYSECVCIGGEPWTVGQTFDKAVVIRAAFPSIGATICSQQPEETTQNDKPCISISTCDNETLEGVQKGISVRLSHLRIEHSTPGVRLCFRT